MPRKQPNTNTLRGISDLAERDYKQHERLVKNAKRIGASLALAALADIEVVPEVGNPGWKKDESWKEYHERLIQGRTKGNLERATEHYKQHQDEYFESGVKLADFDSVKIRVEQPFTVGEKIEVHRYSDPDIT